ncbi:phage terminase large subunit [Deinococcus sp. SL84]|uniref:phage terminase large subunit n=1 Tax=Deinococcus sp. SL84 TaxID=2994663 RepID=UPI002274D129|nr:phage terminase large subunit [Deinococcus sp. SL84]MCY1703647.1 phage terminase large subunit [Deinococcus sp. SL84]
MPPRKQRPASEPALPADAVVIQPQPGPQTTFFRTPADIAIYGGAAGGGKSWSLLVEPLRHISNPRFGATIFRREYTQVFNEGGLWDEAMQIYPTLGAKSNQTTGTFTFQDPATGKPTGASVSFGHLQHEKDILKYQGSQIPLVGFDELTHFTARQFWYLVTRNRSTCGVRPYVRAATNPDPDSWVAEFIAWWIDQDEFLADGVTPNPGYGFPIAERAGKLRYMLREGDTFYWGNTAEEALAALLAAHPYAEQTIDQVKSVTFIPARLEDNRVLMEKDPGYKGNLMMQDAVTRAQLLGGNWKARLTAGILFQRGWVELVPLSPIGPQRIRYWDRAATPPSKDNPDPDWTVGTLLTITPAGLVFVEDVVRLRGTPGEVQSTVKATAQADEARYPGHIVGIEVDPGSAGKAEAAAYATLLAGFNVRFFRPTTKKEIRFGPFSAQAEAGNVRVVKGAWNSEWFSELEAFPKGDHDDQVDSVSGAYNALVGVIGAVPDEIPDVGPGDFFDDEGNPLPVYDDYDY